MLVIINGIPGVGKLSVGRELATIIGARLLDAHTVYNLSLALTEHKSEDFFNTIRSIWLLADELILKLPTNQPVVFTEALAAESSWADETWARYQRLAEARGELFTIHLHCDVDENARRISSSGRLSSRKPVDPDYARNWHKRDRALMGHDAIHKLTLDTTELEPHVAAKAIAEWLKG